MTDPALAVAIESFTATARGGFAELAGIFRTAFPVCRVNVYRSDGARSERLSLIDRVDRVENGRFEYVDRGVVAGHTYHYQIGVEDRDGEFLSPIVALVMNAVVGELRQNVPNPFNPSTTIEYSLGERSPAILEVFDATGTLVVTLDQGVQNPGTRQVQWNGRDAYGRAIAAGVYFYRLKGIRNVGSRRWFCSSNRSARSPGDTDMRILLCVLALILALPASAQVTNGDFESGLTA